MGKKQHFQHIGSQSVIGLVMLITASTTALGTTSEFLSGMAGPEGLQTAMQQEQVMPVAERDTQLRKPSCTPGFSCNAPRNQSQRVSRLQALQFALLIGAGTSR